MKRNFDNWLNEFRPSIADYGYYADFPKIYANTENIKVELNILNTLIGSKDIENDFEILIKKYPEILKCLPILIAVRASEIPATDYEGSFLYNFKELNYSIEQYKSFMRKTGLFDLIANHIVSNLYDYVMGVETGLDSNARKNRSGHLMENLVEFYIKQAGFEKDKTYFKELNLSKIEEKYHLDLSAISNFGKTEKRFDFVLKTNKFIYGIETNFYSSGGSKLNETARSYKNLALEAKNIKNFKFVWITDGIGWKSAKNNLLETFDILDDIYNLKDLERGFFKEIYGN